MAEYLNYDGLETLVSRVRKQYDTWRDTIQRYLDTYQDKTDPYLIAAELDTITPIFEKISSGTTYSGNGTISNLLGVYALEAFSTTKSIESTANLFKNATNLYWCNLSNLDMSNVGVATDMFSWCSNLVILRLKKLSCDLDLSDCPLDATSVSFIVKNLSSVSSATLTLSSKSYSYYSDSDLSVKGWTITK